MQINKFGFYVWRHSLRKISDFPFFECLNSESVRELTLDSLNREEIALWMDKLLNRKEGYHSQLLKRGSTSEIIKKLDYASQILISTVIKNDIGVRGGISPLFNSEYIQEPLECFHEILKLPYKAIVVNVDSDFFNPFSLIDLKKESDDYIIPYSTNLHNINITSALADKIRMVSEEIINSIVEDGKVLSDCVLIAIDFFIHNGDAIPFECHFPGRGLGVHLLPFLFSKETRGMVQNVVRDMRKHIKDYYGLEINMNIRNTCTTTFHELDEIVVSLLSDQNSSTQKSIDLDVRESLDDFYMRDYEIKNELDQIIINSPINNYELKKIEYLLGKWIILKTRKNIPWWSKSRKRPEILIVNDKLISRVNYLLQIHGEIILQRLVIDSLDTGGHFGELRAYYLLMR